MTVLADAGAAGLPPSGLSSAKASARRAQFGPNQVEEEQKRPLQRILYQFWSPVPWTLEATVVEQLALGE